MEPTARIDRRWMGRALALARRALGATQPNPLVGAIVLDASGRLVGKGCHEEAGKPHAEVVALDNAGAKAVGGTLFVTLEPCCHFGRTPPCADRILASTLKRVVVATLDPNPKVNGQGISRLRSAGLKVDIGCLEREAGALNLPFQTSIRLGRPMITAKMAVSADSMIGVTGAKVRISGKATEAITMKLRSEAGAIVVGVGTVLADRPQLTVRGRYSWRKPFRVILDPSLRTPKDFPPVASAGGPILIFASLKRLESKEVAERARQLESVGVQVIALGDRFNLREIVSELAKRELTSILVEGGAQTVRTFSDANLIDRWVVYRSSRPLEGIKDGSAIPFPGFSEDKFKTVSQQQRGEDLVEVALRSEFK